MASNTTPPFYGPLIVQCTIIGATIYLIALLTYRLAFHPLAKFPGPKLAAATKWYEFYFDILQRPGGQFAEEIRRMHKVYGPIVRINPSELHVADPEWYDTLYASNPTRRDKYPPAAKMAGSDLAGFGTVEHHLHGKRRAALSPMFSSRAISNAAEIMKAQVELLCNTFRGHLASGSPLELRTVFTGFTMDAVSEYAMGKSMGVQNEVSRAKTWVEAIKGISKTTPVAKQFPALLSFGQKIPLGVIRRVNPAMAQVLQIHKDMYTKASRYLSHKARNGNESYHSRKKATDVDPPLFDFILDSALPAHEKDAHRLAQEGFTVIVAGGDTTARVMALGIFHLLANPRVLNRLQEELDAVMPAPSDMPPLKVLEDLAYLVHLDPKLPSFIKESLRLAAFPTSRLPLTAPGALVYKTWVIPPQTPIGMTPHDVLLDPNIFDKPNDFAPERWLHNPGLERYLVTFGKGTRMCQGMKFAWAEMMIAFATIIRRFELELYATTRERDVDYVGDLFLGAHHPDSLGIRVKVVGLRV
ncbi:MAG: hypothetical protein Q9182_005024 [Xanthomendoza sp. 2 TL-2023]